MRGSSITLVLPGTGSTLSRRWAALGLRSLRCDLSGLGDSPAWPGQAVDEPFPQEALEDLSDWLQRPRLQIRPMCCWSGCARAAITHLRARLLLGAAGVCGINPVIPYKPSELRSEKAARTEKTDSRRQAAAARKWWVRALPAHDQMGALVERMPGPVWWIVNRVAVEQRPARVLGKLVEAGVRTTLISGERDNRILWRGEQRARRRLQRSGLLHLVVLPDIDHELLQRDARERVTEIITDDVLGRHRKNRPELVP